MNKISILVLAAGGSKRMNGIKQLLPYKSSTLLENTLDAVQSSSCKSSYCVLGGNSEKILKNIKFGKTAVLLNPEWEEGLGKSISMGVQKILEIEKELDGIMIVLADQPLINSDYLNKLNQKFQQNSEKIICSGYEKNNGVPAIFPPKYFSKLLKLEGDQGAKNLLNNSQSEVISIEAQHLLLDIDTREDYERLF